VVKKEDGSRRTAMQPPVIGAHIVPAMEVTATVRWCGLAQRARHGWCGHGEWRGRPVEDKIEMEACGSHGEAGRGRDVGIF
jgi:hypothetical protein